MEVLIIGGGIGGLTLGLTLHRVGIASRIFEAAPLIKPIGVGINILPHASRELAELGLEPALAELAVETREAVFFNRFGQLIYAEPLGRHGGYEAPQFSVHRADLHAVLLEAFRQRVGEERFFAGWRCERADYSGAKATAYFRRADTDEALPPQHGEILVDCSGIHSALRKQLYPDEGEPLYSGVNMWRGVTHWPPILSGASMIRAGWLAHGKIVIYPIRNNIDAAGRQLVNWVAELQTPHYKRRDWNRPGRLEDFIGMFAEWHFDWLDVPEFLREAEAILEFPMVDQEPLERWSFGRMTLLGDAAHPMVPRGSNGAGQAILDARALADALATEPDAVAALRQYEAQRLEVTANIVRTNRTDPPDAILREVFERTGDKPFARIEDVISREELVGFSESYKRVAGYDQATLKRTQ